MRSEPRAPANCCQGCSVQSTTLLMCSVTKLPPSLLCVQGVKHPGIEKWSFVAADGVEMPLEEGTSCFITMNPGYIGRAELPESLKALFRPITVMVSPDVAGLA